ncbi:hypothetical protein PtrEW7m1_009269, partial [Pyrenophora tritici-repentis]
MFSNLTTPTSRPKKRQRTPPSALSDIAESPGLNTLPSQRTSLLSKSNSNDVDDTPTPYTITETSHGVSLSPVYDTHELHRPLKSAAVSDMRGKRRARLGAPTGFLINTSQAPALIRSPSLDTFRRQAADI